MGQVQSSSRRYCIAGYGDNKKDALLSLQKLLKFEFGAVVCSNEKHNPQFHVHTSKGLEIVRFEVNGFDAWKAFIAMDHC